ncbi:MAG: succinate--CoA ligase subunit alpha [Deltaproteobacteria bacterium RBG_13_61_14]|nr:MAG: succinate--CoA ligase subunit alpha [Deltaproteobacteria bacterium RBG_13_61_14]
MSVLVDRNTRIMVQGITGGQGRRVVEQAKSYATRIVAGVTPGKGGAEVEGVPVFDTVAEAVRRTGANASLILVPAAFAADAILEAVDAEVPVIACIAEGVPILDMLKVKHAIAGRASVLVGPNCPGVLTPEQCRLGIMPTYIAAPGPVGVVSRSGTLTYETVHALTRHGLGQSTCVGIGGDPIAGTSFVDALGRFEQDPQTKAVVLIGEIGGNEEEAAAEFAKTQMRKPVVAFIAGRSAPPGKRMGHAGAIISGGRGGAKEKIAALERAGIQVASAPEEIPALVQPLLH